MSKVGILSMQRIKNYGSFLQAYALKKMIESIGHDVEFVDYHVNEPLIKDDNKNNIITKGIHTLLSDGKLLHKIQYIHHKNKFAKKYFDLLELSKEPNYNPKLDVLVIGSDEVFNCIQKNKNVGYSLELFGKNSNSNKLVTYAASFGNTTLEKIRKYNKQNELSELLNKFDTISVRDNNSGNIISSITNIEPIFNLDPVLVYDYMGSCSKVPNIDLKEKYMILYAYSGRITKKEAKIIKKYCDENKVKIYSIGGVQPYADKFIDCSPFEVLAFFKKAEFIITDTFHGTIFSIINNKRFATLVRKSSGNEYGNEEKISDLLTRLNLKDRMSYSIDDVIKIVDMELDYLDTNKIINLEREKTYKYLSKI